MMVSIINIENRYLNGLKHGYGVYKYRDGKLYLELGRSRLNLKQEWYMSIYSVVEWGSSSKN